MLREAIILAGGLGTRLRSAVSDLPKVMAPVAGKPFLHYIIEDLISHDIHQIILSTGYKHEVIREFIDSSGYDAEFVISNEEEPLGTGGGIKLAMNHAKAENVLIVNGDTFFKIDPNQLLQEHLHHDSDITIALKPMNDFDRYGTVALDKSRITAFHEKKHAESGLVNAGIYILRRSSFNSLHLPDRFSLEKDVFEMMLDKLRITGVPFSGYFIDIGIPEDYQKAQSDFASRI
jgi:D-glycero-alpha-D-manno-heptose 1-phosphate guanylyltransferase